MKSARFQKPIVLCLAVIALASVAGASAYWAWRLPKRFGEVVPGKLYRSGTVTPGQLERLRDDYHITRVLSLLDPTAPESRAEQQACIALGLQYVNVPLRGNGASTPADRERIVSILTEADAPPTLIHCAAGTNRTGLATGLYRIHVEGWPLERVTAELKSYDFEDGPSHENLRAALREAAETRRSPASRPAAGD